MLEAVKSTVHDVSRRWYGTERALHDFILSRAGHVDPILVYSVGKVGSTSVASAIEDHHPHRPVYHIHWLTGEHLDASERSHRAGSKRYRGTARQRRFHQRHVWLGRHVAEEIARSDAVWDVITLVRDPMARNVSSFFQNLPSFFDIWPDEDFAGRRAGDVADELVEVFLDAYPPESEAIETDGNPLTWFDVELKPVFGVDVYREEFDFTKGFATYRGDNARVLLVRLEDLDRVAGEAFATFLGIEGVSIGRSNDGANKAYADVYDLFRERLDVPESYLDRLYESRYARHFYTDAEIAGFRSRWEGSGQTDRR